MAAVSGWWLAITAFKSFSGYLVSGVSFCNLLKHLAARIEVSPMYVNVELGLIATVEDMVRVVVK